MNGLCYQSNINYFLSSYLALRRSRWLASTCATGVGEVERVFVANQT
jgi:hypothetical protein